MSLRSVGNQLLQTAPSPLLNGASSASFSLWILVNPGNNVSASAGVVLFGDAGGKCSATLSGSGNLQLKWSSINGNTPSVSTCNLTLVPGTSYHLAMVWRSGAQQYYLNGVAVKTDTQTGVIGLPGASSSQMFRIGSDQSGTDVTLDELTLWVGYALSAQDVANLRDRVSHPEGISPSSIALQWSLAGTTGQTAQVGDSGLTDASATGLNLTTIVGTAPSYVSGVLTYVAPPTVAKAQVAPSGTTISLVFQDGTGALANVSSLLSSNEVQQISLSGVPSASSITVGFGGQTTSPLPVSGGGDPLWFGDWILPVTPGVSLDIAATFKGGGPFFCSQALYAVFGADGKTLLASRTINQQVPPYLDSNADQDSSGPSPVYFYRIGIVTPPGPTIRVRVSGSTDGKLIIDAVRLIKTSNGTKSYYSNTDPTFTHHDGTSPNTNTFIQNPESGTYSGLSGAYIPGAGTVAAYGTDVTAFQTALQGLSSVGSGNVRVTALGQASTFPFSVEFIGALGKVGQNLLAISDSAFTVTHTNPGGIVPAITVNGGSPIKLYDWVWGKTGIPYLPYAYSLLSGVTIKSTDNVVITLPDGYFTTSAGPITGVVNRAMQNQVGKSLCKPFVVTRKKMPIGYNVTPQGTDGELIDFSNLARRMDLLGIAQDANGYPTKFVGTGAYGNGLDIGVATPSYVGGGGDGLRGYNLPSGHYTFRWQSPGNMVDMATANGFPPTEVVQYQNVSGTVKTRVFDFQPINGERSPSVRIQMTSTTKDPTDSTGTIYLSDLANLQIYPPDPSDPTGMTPWGITSTPPKFHPSWKTHVQGASCLRFLDPLNANSNSFSDFSQIKTDSYICRDNASRIAILPVASVSDYGSTPPFWNPTHRVVKVTTTVPHGLFDYAFIIWNNAGTAVFSDGASYPLTSDNYKSIVRVVDSTTLLIQIDWYSSLNASNQTVVTHMTNTLSGGTITAYVGTPWTLLDITDACKVANADCWLPIPLSVSDACNNAMADFFAANLQTGKKLYLEFFNETWNYAFRAPYCCWQLTYLLNGDTTTSGQYQLGYVTQAKHVHDLWAARFALAGRSKDLVRVLSGQAVSAGQTTDPILGFARSLNAQVDAYAIGPYWNNDGDPAFNSVYDTMDGNQLLDNFELVAAYGLYGPYVSSHRPVMNAHGYQSTALVAYEASPDNMIPNGDQQTPPNTPNFYSRMHVVQHHPRMYGITLQMLQTMQDAGLSLYNQYFLGGYTGAHAWSAWQGFNQLPGTGNWTTDSVNITSPEAMNLIKSELGGAYQYWNSLAKPVSSVNQRETTGFSTTGPLAK